MYMPAVFVSAIDCSVDGGALDVGLTVSFVVGGVFDCGGCILWAWMGFSKCGGLSLKKTFRNKNHKIQFGRRKMPGYGDHSGKPGI